MLYQSRSLQSLSASVVAVMEVRYVIAVVEIFIWPPACWPNVGDATLNLESLLFKMSFYEVVLC